MTAEALSQFQILVVEDESKVAEFIIKGLSETGYKVTWASDATSALDLFAQKNYDLVLLDIKLPDHDGFFVCQQIRTKNKNIPILMLTAYGDIESKLIGFETGADDYLIKPFNFSELTARIKSLLKRVENQTTSNDWLRALDLEVDLISRRVLRNQTTILLTPKEYALLIYLMKNKNKTVSRLELSDNVWGISFDTGTNVVDVYINFLRNKIDKPFSTKLIQTIVGMGYVLRDEPLF